MRDNVTVVLEVRQSITTRSLKIMDINCYQKQTPVPVKVFEIDREGNNDWFLCILAFIIVYILHINALIYISCNIKDLRLKCLR